HAVLGANAVLTYTILDDDPTPTVQFTSASQSVSEGAGTATLTAQLSNPSAWDVTVPFTVSGSATGNGLAYTMAASTLTIPAGSTTGTISVAVVDDSKDEADETVVVTLGTPTNATPGATSFETLTILDNDPPPQVAFNMDRSRGDEGTTHVSLRV